MPPAPAAVPVERFVGNGLVSPLTDRPVSGVWSRSRSRPELRRGAVFRAAVRRVVAAAFFAVVRRVGAAAFLAAGRRLGRAAFLARARAFGAAFRAGLLARVVFFLAVTREALLLPLRLFPAAFFAVFFRPLALRPFAEPFRAEPAAVRFAAFLAMVTDPRPVIRSNAAGERQAAAAQIDCRPVSDVSSNAYRNQREAILQPAGAEIPASTTEEDSV
jgi:hypothetical protein